MSLEFPELLLIIMLLAGMLMLVHGMANRLQRPVIEHSSFVRRKSMLNTREQIFYRALSKAVGNQLLIFTKVRLDQIVLAGPGTPRAQLATHTRLRMREVDFLLCDPFSSAIVAAVLLEYPAAEVSPHRLHANAYIAEALDSAGIHLLRFDASQAPDPIALAADIFGPDGLDTELDIPPPALVVGGSRHPFPTLSKPKS
jgi:hypothetical protein